MKLLHVINLIRDASRRGEKKILENAITSAFKILVHTASIDQLRLSRPETWDFEVPTRLAFAIHVQLLANEKSNANDRQLFADFLNAYYEEWDDWAQALREFGAQEEN